MSFRGSGMSFGSSRESLNGMRSRCGMLLFAIIMTCSWTLVIAADSDSIGGVDASTAAWTRTISGACSGNLTLHDAIDDMRVLLDLHQHNDLFRPWKVPDGGPHRCKANLGAPSNGELGLYLSFTPQPISVEPGDTIRIFVDDTPWAVNKFTSEGDARHIFIGTIPSEGLVTLTLIHADVGGDILWHATVPTDISANVDVKDTCPHANRYRRDFVPVWDAALRSCFSGCGGASGNNRVCRNVDSSMSRDSNSESNAEFVNAASCNSGQMDANTNSDTDTFANANANSKQANSGNDLDWWHTTSLLDEWPLMVDCNFTSLASQNPDTTRSHAGIWSSDPFWSGLHVAYFHSQLVVSFDHVRSRAILDANATVRLFAGINGVGWPTVVGVDQGRVTVSVKHKDIFANRHLMLETKHVSKDRIPVIVTVLLPCDKSSLDQSQSFRSLESILQFTDKRCDDPTGLRWAHAVVTISTKEIVPILASTPKPQSDPPFCTEVRLALPGCEAAIGLQLAKSAQSRTTDGPFIVAVKPTDRRMQQVPLSTFSSREIFRLRVDGPARQILRLQWSRDHNDMRATITFPMPGEYRLELVMPVPSVAPTQAGSIPGHNIVGRAQYLKALCPDIVKTITVNVTSGFHRSPEFGKGSAGASNAHSGESNSDESNGKFCTGSGQRKEEDTEFNSFGLPPAVAGHWVRTSEADMVAMGAIDPGADYFRGWSWVTQGCRWRALRGDSLQACVASHGWDEIVWLGDSRERTQFEAGAEDVGAATALELRHLVDNRKNETAEKKRTGKFAYTEVHRLDKPGFPSLVSLYLRSRMEHFDVLEEGMQWEVLLDHTASVIAEQKLCVLGSRGLLIVSPPLWELRSQEYWGQGVSTYVHGLRQLCPNHKVVFNAMPSMRDHRTTSTCRLGLNCEMINSWVQFQNSETVNAGNVKALQQANAVPGVAVIDTRPLTTAMWDTGTDHDDGVHNWKGPHTGDWIYDSMADFVARSLVQIVWNTVCDP